MNIDEERKRYDAEGNRWEQWLGKADALLAGATCLRQQTPFLDNPSIEFGKEPNWDELRLHWPMLLLRACALECLLKACWLRQGNRLFEGGKYKGIKRVRDHELLELARAVSFQVDSEEAEVLVRLSKYGVGYGRYPALRSFEQAKARRGVDGMFHPVAYWGHASERPLEAMVKRARAALEGTA